jgi:RimJ/RimL family protein N-acetyltransferase
VRLREIALTDAHTLFALITNDPKVQHYISAPPPSEAAFAGFIAWCHRERAAGKCVCFAVTPRGLDEAVGLFQVKALDPDFFTAEWGFALGSAFWSTGVFEEAATLVADFTFETLGAHRIEGRAATANGRGNGALMKIGAVSEAVLEAALERDGMLHEQVLWTLIREEWNARSGAVRERFSADEVREKVQHAIQDVQAQLVSTPPEKQTRQAEPYPFFIGGGSSKKPN